MKNNEQFPFDWDDEDNKGTQTGGGSGDQGEGGLGGAGGKIRYRYKDAASLEPRDDMLSPNELQRLLNVHKDLHKGRVDKQKVTRKEREATKQGNLKQAAIIRQQAGYAQRGGSHSRFKQHPVSNMAQFSGIDKQLSSMPTINEADTNLEARDQLDNRLENNLQLRNAPKFNPTFRPRGM